MEIVDINAVLTTENLFELFKAQLRKDFEGAGLDAAFIGELPAQFELLKRRIALEVGALTSSHVSSLTSLMYRVDISEMQLKNRQLEGGNNGFDDLVAELIIKRVLQKVILKKKFSN